MTAAADLGQVTLIGIDGGATEVKAHIVRCVDPIKLGGFQIGDAGASRKYEHVDGFAPLPAAEQIIQRDAGTLALSADEKRQGQLWIQAACDAVCQIVEITGVRDSKVLIGVGMPGLKTADRRGIEVINNGPRIPDYLDQLERTLSDAGVRLAVPIVRLDSDADCCGVGERLGAKGLFRDVENAYYVGCGTGIADAMLLDGKLVPFDDASGWICKSWQLASSLGPSFEKLISARAINDCYACQISVDAPDQAPYPESAAAGGEPIARTWMQTVAMLLAELVFERLDTVHGGRRALPHRGAAYGALNPDHPYRNTALDRVVIGQRLGMILDHPEQGAILRDQLAIHLAALIAKSGHADMKSRLLSGGRLVDGFVRASRLRAAPALGAAIMAARQAIR